MYSNDSFIFAANIVVMEMKHLLLVKNIVELGGLSKSADKLCLSQSALSHQLKEAETQAGTALFLRANKKMRLTPAGELVYHTALDVLGKIDELHNNLKAYTTGDKGTIRICTACFTNYHWLPKLITKFNEMHPQVEIKIHPEYINECIERMLNNDLDAVIMNKPENNKKIRFHEIIKDELVAIVPPEHPWTKKNYAKAADFKEVNLIVFSKPMHTVVVYSKLLKPNGIEPMHIYEAPMTEAIVEMILAGMGVAVIPRWVAKPYIDAGKIVPVRVTPKGLYRSLGVGVLEKDSYPVYYQTLIDFLKENLEDKEGG